MSRQIKYLKPEAGQKPAVRIEFKGAAMNDYYSLRRIAIQDFDVTQTELGRLIICEWLKRYRDAVKSKDSRTVRQLSLALGLEGSRLERVAETAGKVGG